MNKSELVRLVAEDANLSTKQAEAAVNATFHHIIAGVLMGGRVSLHGYGTFDLTRRAERNGVNPKTGAKITIPARQSMTFKPAKQVRDLLN